MGLPENKNQRRSMDAVVPTARRRPGTLQPQLTYVSENPSQPVIQQSASSLPAVQNPPVSDLKKRTFLRLAGVAGIGTIAAMLLPKKAQAYVFGGSPTTAVVGIKDANNTRMTPAQETGGNLAQINLNTAPMLVSTQGAYIQQDSSGSIAKETGNLQTISTNIPAKGQATMSASMPVTIASDQTALPISASFSGALALKDTSSTQINPATDDAVTFLRRIVKQVDSLAVVDSAQRQKITIDTISAGVTLPTVTTVTTVSTVTAVTAVTSVNQLNGVDPKYLMMDTARNSFANGIRPNLVWS